MNTDETTVVPTATESAVDPVESTVVADPSVTADPLDAIEDIEELRKAAKTHRSVAQRYKKDAKQPKPQSYQTEDRNNIPVRPLDILRDEAFKLYREGYDEEEIDLIVKNGGRKILEDKSNPIYLGLEARRQQREAERAASQTSAYHGASEVERKYTQEQLKNMSVEELAKILPHA